MRAYLEGVRDLRGYRCHPLLMPTVRPDGRMNLPCLERPRVQVDLRGAGDYMRALAGGWREEVWESECRGRCHIFCHMALSLLQRHPLAALGEAMTWRART